MTIYNTNKQPYFDDFNPSKNFASVLFKPRVPVQARELNQVQSIFYHQLNMFSSHIFKHGSPVKGNPPKHVVTNYATLEGISPYDAELVNINKLQGLYLKGSTSGIEATLIHSLDRTNHNPYTIYVKYTKTAIDNTTTSFLNGEVIHVIDINGNITYKVKVRCPSCPGQSQSFPNINPTGYGVLWFIQSSTYFVDGMFIDVSPNIIVAEKYTRDQLSYKIGFDLVTDIVTSDDDNSLLDNALGFPNYQAPGADRERVRLISVVRSLKFEDGDKFILLATVEKGKIKYINDTPIYADIMDTIARRTYDESGNYTVEPFSITFKEHLAKSPTDPNGVYPLANGGDENKIVGIVSSGKGYVRGYEVRKQSETKVIIDKPRDTKKVANYLNRIGGLNYVLIDSESIVNNFVSPNPIGNVTSIFSNLTISLYDAAPVNGLPNGNIIGHLKGVDMEVDFQYGYFIAWRLYFVDLQMNPGKQYDSVRGLSGVLISGAQTMRPYNDPVTNKPRVYDSNKNTWIYPLNKLNVKTLKDIQNNTQSSMGYSQRKRFTGILDSTGAFTWTSSTNEKFDEVTLGSTYAYMYSNGVYTPIAYTQISMSTDGVTDTLRVATNNSGNVGKTVQLIHTVMNNNVYEKTKSIVSRIDTNLQLNNGTISLTKSDLYKIKSIKLNDTDETDVTKHFKWTTGQLDWAYVPIVITAKNTAPVFQDAIRFNVEYEYYQHSDTGHFFSVDSYNEIINTNTSYGYSNIPTYISSDKKTYQLRDYLDFRPLILNANSFDFTQPALNSVYTSDIEYYLPRIDLIVVNKDGLIYSKAGVSSETPVSPEIDSTSEMAIYSYRLNSYLHNIEKDVATSFIENKRYTMRDIGKLENRIVELEKFTNFTTAEQRVVDTPVKNSSGVELYKNGFVVDGFNNFTFSAIDDPEYRCVIDRASYEVIPQYSMFSTNFEFSEGESLNYKKFGDILTLNFIEETFVTQPFASEALKINDHIVPDYVGKVIMVPNIDNWADLANDPKIVADVKVGVNPNTTVANPLGLAGVEANVWEWLNGAASRVNYSGESTSRLLELDTNPDLSFSKLVVNNPYKNPENAKAILKIWPLIRKQRVQFFATGLKPNTRIYCFFDSVNVSEFCRPLLTQANYGDPIIVDAKGNVTGEVKIPGERFRCGPKQFRLANTIDANTDPFAIDTWAETIWWAAGAWAISGKRQNVFTSIWRTAEQRNRDNVVADKDWNKPDPIAQTFTVTKDCYITSINLYFQYIHPDDRIELEIRNVIDGAGIPGYDILGSCNKRFIDITPSNDASIGTTFNLIYPVCVKAGYQYAIVITSINPQTKIWMGGLGAADINQYGKVISKQLDTGRLYKSQNDNWEEIQNTDLKLEVCRAIFTHNSMQLTFKNKVLRDDIAETDVIETQFGSNQVRIHKVNHGVAINDVYRFDFVSGIWLNFTLNNLNTKFTIGQKIITSTGSGIISDIRPGSNSTIECQLSDILGYFNVSQPFTVNSFTPSLTDTYLVNSFIQDTTLFDSTMNVTGVCNTSSIVDINGIPSSEFNRELPVIAVDSTNSFIVQVAVPATISGRVDRKVYLNVNLKYDKFVMSGSYTAINCTEKWEFEGVGHSSYSLFNGINYIKQPVIPFKMGDTVLLDSPYKFANEHNETRVFGSPGKSIKIKSTFSSENQYLTPVVNIKSLSLIGISNKIDDDTISNFNVEPNGSNRLILETDKQDGVVSYKYVSKVMALKNPAKELKIMIDVCKPRYSNFDIYIKTLDVGDSKSVDEVPWILMPIDFKKNFTSATDKDFQYIEFIVGEILPSAWDNKTSSFRAVKIKLVGKSKNSANPPKFKNLKVVALT